MATPHKILSEQKLRLNEVFQLCDTRVHFVTDEVVSFQTGNIVVFLNTNTKRSSFLSFPRGVYVDSIAVGAIPSYQNATISSVAQVVCATHGSESKLEVFEYPSKQLLQSIPVPNLMSLSLLSLSRDGRYLAGVARLGASRLLLFDLVLGRLLCETTVPEETSFVSINPFNPSQLAVGHSKQVSVWTAFPLSTVTYRHPTLTSVEVSIDNSSFSEHLVCAHAWVGDGHLVLSTRKGELLEAYTSAAPRAEGANASAAVAQPPAEETTADPLDESPSTGSSKVLCTPVLARVPLSRELLHDAEEEEQDDEDEHKRDRPRLGRRRETATAKVAEFGVAMSLAVANKYIVMGTEDGSMMWYSLESREVVVCESIDSCGVCGLTMGPSFTSLSALTTRGNLRLVRLIGEPSRIENGLQDQTIFQIVAVSQLPLGVGVRSHLPIKCGVVVLPPAGSAENQMTASRMATFGANGLLHLWSFSSRAIMSSYAFKSPITAAAASHDGNLLVLGLGNGVVSVLDVSDSFAPRTVWSHRLHAGPVLSIDFNHDGTLFASVCAQMLCFIRCAELQVVLISTYPSTITDEDTPPVGSEQPEQVTHMQFVSLPRPGSATNPRTTMDKVALATSKARLVILDAPEPEAELPDLLAPDESMMAKPLQLSSSITALRRVPGAKGTVLVADQEKTLRVMEVAHGAANTTNFLEHHDHGKHVTLLSISDDGRFMASGGADGMLIIRALGSFAKMGSAAAHSHTSGGVRAAVFNSDCSTLLSAGFDGAVFTWALTDVLEAKSFQQERSAVIRSATLQKLPTVPDASGDSATFLELYEKKRTSDHKDHAQKRAGEDLEDKLTRFKMRFKGVLARNEQVQELERLDLKEFVIDKEMMDQLTEEGHKQVAKLRSELIEASRGKELVAARIKLQCWDSMVEKGGCLRAFKANTELHNFPLRAHTPEETQQHQQILFLRKMQVLESQWIKSTRRGDDEHPEREFHPSKLTEGATYIVNIKDTHSEPFLEDKSSVAPNSAQQANRKIGGKEKQEDATQSAPRFFLLSPFACITSARKRMQASLLAAKIDHLKREFNKELAAMMQSKTRDIDVIQDKYKRVREIQAELGTDTLLAAIALHPEEVPNNFLLVDDAEIKAAKVLSPEEHTQRERQEEEARRKREQQDDGPDRGLQVMMNGTLEVKRDLSALEKELVREPWMDELKPEEMTEEQQLIMAQYEKKLKMIQVEQDNRRKLLQTELSKLLNDVNDICRTFDGKLRNLANKRVTVQREVYLHELMIVKLMNDLHSMEDHETREKAVNKRMHELSTLRSHSSQLLFDFKKELEACGRKLEVSQMEEKAMERSFKKDFQDAGEHLDLLVRLFRSRKRSMSIMGTTRAPNMTRRVSGAKEMKKPANPPNNAAPPAPPAETKNGDKPSKPRRVSGALQRQPTEELRRMDSEAPDRELSHDSLSPYGMEISKKDSEQRLTDLRASDRPDDLHPDIWTRFLQRRKQQHEKELEVRRGQQQLADMTRQLAILQSQDDRYQAEFKRLSALQTQLGSRRLPLLLDTECMVRIKQGQVEVEEAPVVTDLKDCVMIERGIVESINSEIANRGHEKVDILRDITRQRTHINMRKWQQSKLDLEHEEAIDLTTTLQLLRVTKNLQSLIKMGGHDQQKAAELKRLDRKIEFTNQSMEEVAKRKAEKLVKVQSAIQSQMKENERLMDTVKELENAVKERSNIAAIKKGEEHDDARIRDDRMKTLVTRRKLVDLAKLQSEEIQFLREQVNSLRRSTYAAFALPPVQPNPDERRAPSHTSVMSTMSRFNQTQKRPDPSDPSRSLTR